MENASSLCPTMPIPLILDVELGIGTTKYACLAPTDGSSTPTRFAPLFLTNAPATITTEPVLPATRDTILSVVLASSLPQTTPSPPIQDAEPGIGTTKYAFHAQRDGLLMLIRFASQFLISALQAMVLETVLLAIRDTTL